MTLLPPLPGRDEVMVWRLDRDRHAPDWDSGEGAYRLGGRWNSAGVRAVYCSLDPATAILEVAVHKTFGGLDTVPHVLTAARLVDPADIFVVEPTSVPNPNWLHPGTPGAGQQRYGDALLATHLFVAIPSAVSRHSWNLVFDASRAKNRYSLAFQERFALDTRLNPPAALR